MTPKFDNLVLSENLKFHYDHGFSLDDCIFRIGSDSYNKLVCEMRSLYNEGKIELNRDDKFIIEKLKTGEKAVNREGETVTLDSPQRISDGNKKFRVWRDSGKKDKEGRIIAKKIEWGDPNLSVKNCDEKASASFLARHNCKDKTDMNTPGWWACNVHRFAKALNLTCDTPW